MTAALTLSGVAISYGPRTVLREVSLTVAPGEVVAIYGRSGSGKTTLLNLMGGLDRPTAGMAAVAGQNLAALPPHRLDQLRRTRMAFVFQSFGLLSHLTARENVDFALRLAGCPRAERNGRTAAALAAVGLARRADHRPGELSGGEQQRTAIARAIAVQPRLLLADEPTGALDHQTGLEMLDLLAWHARETGAAVCIGTHDPAVRARADRTFRLDDGRLIPE